MISCYSLHATSSIFHPYNPHSSSLRLCYGYLISSSVGFDDPDMSPKVCLWIFLANAFICKTPRFFSSQLFLHLNVLNYYVLSSPIFFLPTLYLVDYNQILVSSYTNDFSRCNNFSCTPFTENFRVYTNSTVCCTYPTF